MKFTLCICLCVVASSWTEFMVQAGSPLVYFRAVLPSGWTYKLGSTIVFSQVKANEGSGYLPSSGIFRAPIAGLYLMKCQLETTNHGTSEFTLERQGSKETVLTIQHQYSSKTMSVILHLNVGDHVLVRKTYDEMNAPLRGGLWSQFSGYLLRRD